LAEAFPLGVFPDAVGISPERREHRLGYGSMVFNGFGPAARGCATPRHRSAGDLGLSAALGEQLSRAQTSGLACGTLFGRAGRRVVGIRGSSHTTHPAVTSTTKLNSCHDTQ
jgi:hypothetical protein